VGKTKDQIYYDRFAKGTVSADWKSDTGAKLEAFASAEFMFRIQKGQPTYVAAVFETAVPTALLKDPEFRSLSMFASYTPLN